MVRKGMQALGSAADQKLLDCSYAGANSILLVFEALLSCAFFFKRWEFWHVSGSTNTILALFKPPVPATIPSSWAVLV